MKLITAVMTAEGVYNHNINILMTTYDMIYLSQRGIRIQNPRSFQRSSGGRYTPSTKKT